MSDGLGRCRNALFVAALGACLLVGGAALAPAGDHASDCERRIHKAEDKLRKEIDRHGEHSPQAEQKRHDLEEVRRSCGEDHR